MDHRRRSDRPPLRRGALLSACLVVSVACTQVAQPRDDPSPETQARAAAAHLKSTLMRELSEALQAGGPIAALTMCADRAQALTAASSTPRARVGRTSHRLRNPANRAPPWLQERVDALARGEAVAPGLVAISPGRLGYVEPLITQPLCTTCHGTAISPELRAVIASRYPQDAAVGFEAGEVRGLLWVEVGP